MIAGWGATLLDNGRDRPSGEVVRVVVVAVVISGRPAGPWGPVGHRSGGTVAFAGASRMPLQQKVNRLGATIRTTPIGPTCLRARCPGQQTLVTGGVQIDPTARSLVA